jgi:hypothetical protein
MMKKIEDAEKVADEIAGVGEENPASKKTLLHQVQDRTGFRQQAAVLLGLLGGNYRLRENGRNRLGNLDGRFDKKVWPQSRQGGIHDTQGDIEEIIIYISSEICPWHIAYGVRLLFCRVIIEEVEKRCCERRHHGRWQENPAGLIHRFASVRGSGASAQILMARSTVPAIVGRHRNGWQAS